MTNPWEEIVEERIWRTGVEIVSRVNWSQIARVRQSLGVAEGFGGNPLQQVALQARAAAATRPRGPDAPQLPLGRAWFAPSTRVVPMPARRRWTDFADQDFERDGTGVTRQSA